MTDDKSGSSDTTSSANNLLSTLRERAKELSCLYAVEKTLADPGENIPEVLKKIVQVIPPGWQYTSICQAKVVCCDDTYQTDDFKKTPWTQTANIMVGDTQAGQLTVAYNEEKPPADKGPFLKEESKLIKTIADRLGHFILHQQTLGMFKMRSQAHQSSDNSEGKEWRFALDLLRQTDQNLLSRISRKMMNYLCRKGVKKAESLLHRYGEDKNGDSIIGETNQPIQNTGVEGLVSLEEETFKVAQAHLSNIEILFVIKEWINEDKFSFLVSSIIDGNAPLSGISDALNKFKSLSLSHSDLSKSALATVKVALIRRFFTDQLEYINVAKNFIDVEDFFSLVENIVAPLGSNGKLGGKSAGLFLANKILKSSGKGDKTIGEIHVPKTWYVASDGLLEFLRFNSIEDVYEQKYKIVEEVRQEYPQIIQIFKNAHFPQEMVKGFSTALDNLGQVPLVVRSSSLLEDRLGSAFSGKYKSLFLANQGSKEDRLEALIDAIAEVYASTFGPDPIEYRAARGLLDFNEEMGIMIQEVVGTRVGDYYMPTFAGVAFSNNEFRWSSRIKREDGLVRLVPGLGTRAVDRLTDDYPMLAAPGQPGLRVNASTEDMIKYSPKQLDVIDLAHNKFITMSFSSLSKDFGDELKHIHRLVSICKDGRLTAPEPLTTNYKSDDIVVTFEGIFTRTPFLKKIRAILKTLEKSIGTPVDIEFAVVGDELYLLQCRPQSCSKDIEAAHIPKELRQEDLLFNANKYISNGRIQDITHLVYVSPESYGKLVEHVDLVSVGTTIGQLNKLLPKRQFILMGPGRWGSRGDIKLGVRVTYSNINNTAMLIEIARKKGDYVPDLSFGTHFFQDLVESSIRYLPLYPDDDDITFNENFLTKSPNILKHLLPNLEHLEDVIHVIDIKKTTNGKILRILTNAAQEEAVGLICPPESDVFYEQQP